MPKPPLPPTATRSLTTVLQTNTTNGLTCLCYPHIYVGTATTTSGSTPVSSITYALCIVTRRNPLSSSASNCIPQMLLVFYLPQLSEFIRTRSRDLTERRGLLDGITLPISTEQANTRYPSQIGSDFASVTKNLETKGSIDSQIEEGTMISQRRGNEPEGRETKKTKTKHNGRIWR